MILSYHTFQLKTVNPQQTCVILTQNDLRLSFPICRYPKFQISICQEIVIVTILSEFAFKDHF